MQVANGQPIPITRKKKVLHSDTSLSTISIYFMPCTKFYELVKEAQKLHEQIYCKKRVATGAKSKING